MPIAVGLDIGSEAVRAAAVEVSSPTPVLARFGEVPLPPGAVVGGDVVDEGVVTGAIRALWKRHQLPRRRVVVGIAGGRVVAQQVTVPRMDETELTASMLEEARAFLPVAAEEAVLDYTPLAEFTDSDGNTMVSLLLVATERELVEDLLRMAQRVGFRVMAVDLQAYGLIRAAFGTDILRGGTQGLLDIGATLTQLAVVEGGITRYVRMAPFGGSRFTEALVTGASLPWEDAEQRKRYVGVVPSGLPTGEGERATLGRLLTRTADSLIEEVRGWLHDYLARAGQGSLQRLLVAGSGARLPHLAHRMARALGTRVEPARVLDHISVGRIRLTEPELLRLQPVLPAAVGLALWGRFASPPTRRLGTLE
jgi:type IV pilus assembly protein PilM